MRYEKKMLILSGIGKGVVLMEKSALGVKFALRTFSVPAVTGLKAGVIARSCVVVRELPACADPSLVFYIDDNSLDLSYLHFAVFDSSLKLYGATCKRMWESNIMDLLFKADRLTAPPPMLQQSIELTPLPKPPLKPILPDPDGSGNPQLRAMYGDDLIAGDNYYTPFDISSRMKEVDGFLDTPRVLDGLSPHIDKIESIGKTQTPRTSLDAPPRSAEPFQETPQSDMRHADTADSVAYGAPDKETEMPKPNADDIERPMTDAFDDSERPEADNDTAAQSGRSVDTVSQSGRSVDTVSENVKSVDPAAELGELDEELTDIEEGYRGAMQEAAATGGSVAPADSGRPLEPWERTAEYLKSLDTAELVVRRETVGAVAPKTQVKRVREASFFEKCRADVDKLFSSAVKDGELNAILPDIEWVKVPFDGHTVSVGRGGDVFLCYAVPGMYAKISPLGKEAQWLPKHKNAPTGRGYWLIFQDLKSGGIIGGA